MNFSFLSRKLPASVTILTLVVVVLVGIILIVQCQSWDSPRVPDNDILIEIVNWKVYSDKKTGVKFRYPEEWQLKEAYNNSRIMVKSPNDSYFLIYPKRDQFGVITAKKTDQRKIKFKGRTAKTVSYLTSSNQEWARDIRIIDHPKAWGSKNLIHLRSSFLELKKECSTDKDQTLGSCEGSIKYIGKVDEREKKMLDGILNTLNFTEQNEAIQKDNEKKKLDDLPWEPLCGNILNNPFEVEVKKGEGLTHLAREATQGYITGVKLARMGQQQKVPKFSGAEKVFVEDYIKDYLDEKFNQNLKVGQKVKVSCSTVEAGFMVVKQFSSKELENLENYGRSVVEINDLEQVKKVIKQSKGEN